MNLEQWLIVIPARLESQRLKEKPLQDICGKPMIVRVAENLRPIAEKGANVVVATDHHRIVSTVQEHGISAILTSKDHQSGTDRTFEAVRESTANYILNVQGDEPFINCSDLIGLMTDFEAAGCDMGTLVFPGDSIENYQDPNVVKAVVAPDQRAHYFSRSPLPHMRDGNLPDYYEHIGVYAYKRKSLKEFCLSQPSYLEKTEKLEQLRALDIGMEILCYQATDKARGIDTQKDLDNAIAYFSSHK